MRTANQSGLFDALQRVGRNIAVQAELMGPGIQGNREQLKTHQLFVFDIFDIDEQRTMNPEERQAMLFILQNEGFTGVHCPVIDKAMKLPHKNVDDLLKFAEGPSLKHPIREGIVWKRVDGKFSFKTIANNFLLKEK